MKDLINNKKTGLIKGFKAEPTFNDPFIRKAGKGGSSLYVF